LAVFEFTFDRRRGYVLRRQFSVVATIGLAIETEAIRELGDHTVDIAAGHDDF
jgi:hypothetical protein